LVVFGDSLSDSGNAFAFVHANATPPDFGLNELLVPTVAPYAIGGHHFTNGDTWVEQLASALHIGRFTKPAFASASPNAMNFAIATARARQIPPQSADDEIVPSLAFEIGAYLQKSGGVASPEDGIKAVLAGADAVQMVSALLHHGPSYVMVMRQALEQWLEWHKMGSLAEARGRLSHRRTQDPAAYERANYIRTLQSWSKPA